MDGFHSHSQNLPSVSRLSIYKSARACHIIIKFKIDLGTPVLTRNCLDHKLPDTNFINNSFRIWIKQNLINHGNLCTYLYDLRVAGEFPGTFLSF